METEDPISNTNVTILPYRLVHLDLKGAPPNLDYIQKIFPLMKKWGATGLLIEYEDTFPYEGKLQPLRCAQSYSKQDVTQILELAEVNGLTVIPLVQTFGHFEFVLKHTEFSHLREIQKYPMAVCPSLPESLDLVGSMLDQVMALHPSVRQFHIGCDEVYNLGVCQHCVKVMESKGWTKEQLFFSHVHRVASHLKERHPDMTCIVWDDMFRHADSPTILSCGLGDLVEPMVWHYVPVFSLPDDLWDKLSKVFPHLWVASAFKGATGPRAVTTNIQYHMDNHHAWLQLLKSAQNKFKSIRGVALTGWQRYDHYATLCEFLPVAIPSLALCLRFVQQGNLNGEDIVKVSKDLNFTSTLPINPLASSLPASCEFPGSDVYLIATEFAQLDIWCKEFFTSDFLTVWVSDFNLTRKFINPIHVEPLLSRALFLLGKMKSIEKRTGFCFKDVFLSSSVADEWLGVFVTPHVKTLESFISKAQAVLSAG